MRYNLNISGREYKLIRASLVNFQRSLTASEFDEDFGDLVDELDECYIKITKQQKEQLKIRVHNKWGVGI
mgnify:FL=1|tara:strand:- start:46 stop:255 length:210 start_codon:yes stop_codon:yes gene_type:complete